MKIAVYLPNWIGDAVMATPALAEIRGQWPGAEVVGVLRPYVADVLDGTGLVDRVIEWDPRGGDHDMSGWRLARRLRCEQFDVAVLLPNSLRSAWMAWLSGARRRVGFSRNGRRLLLTDPVLPKSRNTPHPVLDEYLRLVEPLGCGSADHRMHLSVSSRDEADWQAIRASRSDVLGQRPYICFNPGGAFGAAKHWPSQLFGELARMIVAETEMSVVVVCGPSERAEAGEIVAAAGESRVVSLADEVLSLGLTKAVICHAAALVTTDSGPRHFAAPFQVPVVTLFGPTHIAWSETHFEKAIHVQLDLDCGPCQQRTCPLGHHRCMTELAPSRVYRELMSLMKQAQAA
ncbi:MAG: lipopolysaccharide heptosyltransferase II [Planctomycetota bacterium]|nr:lipopolysaccharide heptosyltransferase II [Planctomycetota bacterium]